MQHRRINIWSSVKHVESVRFRNRVRAVWSCLALLPKLAQLQAHRWFLWPSCAIYCAFDLVVHVHEYTNDMWGAPSMWLQYGEVPGVLLELRHLWQWQAWPNCTHPGRENSTDSTCSPNNIIINMYSPFCVGKRWLRCARYNNASCAMYVGPPGGQYMAQLLFSAPGTFTPE
jgi:hypothetical protein